MVTTLREPVLVCVPSIDGNYNGLESLLLRISQTLLYQEHTHFLGNSKNKIVFTGNYFGHGEQGLKVWNCLGELKHMYPEQVTLLAGNQEIISILQRRTIGLAFPPQESASEELLAETLQGKTREDWFTQDTIQGRECGYAPFVKQFSDEGFDNALQKYHESTSESGELHNWVECLKPFETTNFNGRRIMVCHGDVFPHNPDLETVKKTIETFKQAKAAEKEGDSILMRSLLRAEFLTHTFAKRNYVSREKTQQFAGQLDVDYVVTNICGSSGIYHNHGRIIRLGDGLLKEEPKALIFSSKEICKINRSGKVTRVYSN